jgi:hypothetical protein
MLRSIEKVLLHCWCCLWWCDAGDHSIIQVTTAAPAGRRQSIICKIQLLFAAAAAAAAAHGQPAKPLQLHSRPCPVGCHYH